MKKLHGTFSKPGVIRFERILNAPVERVWDYLTLSDLKGKWLAKGVVEPKVGGKVELFFLHKDLCNSEDQIPGKYKKYEKGVESWGIVTNWDPPKLLSYTWAEESDTDSEVTFELKPKGKKTLLILTHRNLGDDHEMLIGVGAGWHTHLGILDDLISQRNPNGFWKVHTALEEEYKQIISNQK